MISIQADEHIRYSVVRGLRDRGVDVHPLPEAGLSGASDEKVFDDCRRRGRVLFTNDDDMLRLAEKKPHPGIIFQTTQFVQPGDLLRAVTRLIDTIPAEDFRGGMFFVP